MQRSEPKPGGGEVDMANWTNAIGVSVTTALSFDAPSNAVWFGTSDGGLWSFRVLGQHATRHGSGWTDIVAVIPATDGIQVVVALADGTVHRVGRATADPNAAHLLVDLATGLIAASALPDGRRAVLTGDGALHAIDVDSGNASLLVDGLRDATHLAIDHVSGEAIIAFEGNAPHLARYDLATGVKDGASVALPQPAVGLTIHPAGAGAIVADSSGNLTAVRWIGVDARTAAVPGVSALAQWHSVIFAASGATIELMEWGADVTTLPIDAGPDPLALGGWVPMTVDYAAIAVNPTDVAWRIVEGPDAGAVSVARPADADRDHYEHRVLGGIGAAEFTVEAVDTTSGTVIATRRFRTVELWPDPVLGPSLAITGPHRVYAKWGGGSAGAENIRTHPAPEEIRMSVVVFRTKGSSSTVDGAARAAQLQVDIEGPGQSVKSYLLRRGVGSHDARICQSRGPQRFDGDTAREPGIRAA
jgi:hypothetical protein